MADPLYCEFESKVDMIMKIYRFYRYKWKKNLN